MKRILIIEDNEETLNNLKSEFENSGFETICCSDFNSANKALENNIPFDTVILDWYFVLEQSCEYSLQLLKLLKKKLFIPVFVYTGHFTDFNNKSEEELGYPKNIISGIDKTITHQELIENIKSLTKENLTLKLARSYREKIHQNLEKVFFELNDSENNSLEKIFSTIMGKSENVDWNNDIILTLLHRHIIADDDFTGEIKETLKNLTDSSQNDLEFNRKILNKIIYHQGKSDYIRNGDIVQIADNSNMVMSLGIVITPDCDLEQSKTRFIELLEIADIEEINSKMEGSKKINIKGCFNHGAFYSFPCVNLENELKDLVAVFRKKIILEQSADAFNNYPDSFSRPLYSHNYILNNNEVRLKPLCSIVEPYKSEFLHKLHSNNSRVGIPDIKKLL
ncbi:MAG: hypothetical protein N3D80_08780 [Ignavibacterium album]|jgi:CheY-like chemotaxis protein|uniref:hypothetical protein n=1 Tax=Ignavibacterium album TaxID=591197 RepID=UPI0026EAA9CC|nr:hypothetical protein [Ignavibacterium album]MCX8105948.1 hypothetical protein [Ignavibacterium album]